LIFDASLGILGAVKPSLLEQAKALPVRERIQLVQEIWDSIGETSVPLTPAQAEELDRRLEDHRRNPDAVISWEEVDRKLKAKYRRA
jgi:putative addiction module component (TIGR02574 family)